MRGSCKSQPFLKDTKPPSKGRRASLRGTTFVRRGPRGSQPQWALVSPVLANGSNPAGSTPRRGTRVRSFALRSRSTARRPRRGVASGATRPLSRFFRRLGGLDRTGGLPRNLAPIVRSLWRPSSGPCPRHRHLPVRLWKFDPRVNPGPSPARAMPLPGLPRLFAGRPGGSLPRRSPRRCPRASLSSGHEIPPRY